MAAAAVQLHAKLANVLWRTARRAEARAAFHAALRLADAGPRPIDPVQRAHLHTRLGRLELTEARYEEATEAFDAAEALIGATGHAGGGSQADDVVADQWLELMVDGRANLHMMPLGGRPRPGRTRAGQAGPRSPWQFGEEVGLLPPAGRCRDLLRNRLRVDDEDIAEPARQRRVRRADRRGQGRGLRHRLRRLGAVAARRPGRGHRGAVQRPGPGRADRRDRPARPRPAVSYPDRAAPARYSSGARPAPAGVRGRQGRRRSDREQPHRGRPGRRGLARLAGRPPGRGSEAGRRDQEVRAEAWSAPVPCTDGCTRSRCSQRACRPARPERPSPLPARSSTRHSRCSPTT